MKKYNFNHSRLYVDGLDFCRTRFEAKVGRKTVYIEVNKNAFTACVKVNSKADFDWNTHIGSAKIPVNFAISRNFIEHIEQISNAQTLLCGYGLPY